ncbi:hypothetical protein GGTG_03773 [Gaeumannomyces tritici R3-111a-1]|uniref:Protein YOP1 n=1 Tax=Gaeumannomyces tritici (strain R3-111a-1) TaxID=644352 RepID=J3NR68_GAET3|nr:hypothetical protein GGTG_03773 [Gaeumannomyces tritici R3-111a-1]EJT78674.1 hypothetical protein GGTG_03773 [Gaeumannomyces tritici R3-111a-1]
MFDIFAKTLSSIASFLFPLFGSYKALKTNDPAQLTPWLMYWVVLACALLVESWTDWFLCWVPFYAYIRLFFFLYLILPQTQGARIIYQEQIHPYLQKNEDAIDEFIASTHEKLRAAGLAYLQDAIEWFKTKVLGLPPTPEQAPPPTAAQSAQSYTQNLFARFSLPAARWGGAAGAPDPAAGGAGGNDVFSMLAGAVSAALSAPSTAAPGHGNVSRSAGASSSIIPSSVGEADKADFIATQRDRLTALLAVLDREAAQLPNSKAPTSSSTPSAPSQSRFGRVLEAVEGLNLEKNISSGSFPWKNSAATDESSGSGLSKSRSEQDFEKIEAESGAEDADDGTGVRRRGPQAGGAWNPFGWGASPSAGGPGAHPDAGASSGVDK